MGNMRTMAFQVPEELFQRIKEYLQRNNMTQKEFVIGLIEDELDREQTERESTEQMPEEAEIYAEEQSENDYSDGFEDENEESDYDEESEDESETHGMGFSMGM